MTRPYKKKKKKLPQFLVSFTTFQLIFSGKKDLLVRAEDWIFSKVSIGGVVQLYARNSEKNVNCLRKIVARRRYTNVADVTQHENLERMAHGDAVATLTYLGRVFRSDQIEGNVVVYELEPMEEKI